MLNNPSLNLGEGSLLSNERAAGRARRDRWIAVALAMLVCLWPVLSYPLPPLADYANHLARMYIIQALPHDPVLAHYYEIDWQVVPNLAMDILVPPLVPFLGIYMAGQAFTVLIFASMMSGTFVLGRVLFGRWTLTPIFGAPFLYNEMLLVGGLNYLLGIGLALWALAAWYCLEGRATVLRLLAAAAMVGVLFFCHLYAVGIFGIGVLAGEVRRFATSDRPLPDRIIAFCLPGFAFVPVAGLLLSSRTVGLSGKYYWDMKGKLSGLWDSIVTYSDTVTLVLVSGLIAAAVIAVRRGRVEAHPLAVTMLGIAGLVYLALPRMLFDTYMADLRLPIAILLLLFATVDLVLPRREALVIMAIAVAMTLVRSIEIRDNWQSAARETKAVEAALMHLKPGARLLTVTADDSKGTEPDELGLDHAASLASILRSALTTRTFTVAGKQILAVKPAFRNHVDQLDGSPPDLRMFQEYARSNDPAKYIYWHDWTERFDNVLVIFTPKRFSNPSPGALDLLAAGDRFALYAVRHP
ncbi:MAG: hypothetical protein ACK5JT_05460 [Hyphomicrobiaceae bacterium]